MKMKDRWWKSMNETLVDAFDIEFDRMMEINISR